MIVVKSEPHRPAAPGRTYRTSSIRCEGLKCPAGRLRLDLDHVPACRPPGSPPPNTSAAGRCGTWSSTCRRPSRAGGSPARDARAAAGYQVQLGADGPAVPGGDASTSLMILAVEPAASARSTTSIRHSGWTMILMPGYFWRK